MASTNAPPATRPTPLPDDPAGLELILYPDPRLRRRSHPVDRFDEATLRRLGALADRMLHLMRQHRGVGLAAPQVGVNIRLFVMNATGEPEDDRVFVNPVLGDPEGEEQLEEGCLSIPDVNTPVWRSLRLRMRARDLHGRDLDETAEGFVARVWQHEVDHLDGVLILDKMPPTSKLVHQAKLRELEEEYRARHPEPPKAPARAARRVRRRGRK